MKDIKCEIQEIICREKQNLKIEAGYEFDTKYTALLEEVEHLKNELDKRDKHINKMIDSIKYLSINI